MRRLTQPQPYRISAPSALSVRSIFDAGIFSSKSADSEATPRARPKPQPKPYSSPVPPPPGENPPPAPAPAAPKVEEKPKPPSTFSFSRYNTPMMPTVVVIGTGWAGAYVAKNVKSKYCSVAVLSQRNHMIFTPMLPQTTSGTLEFRAICEPIARIQPALAIAPNCFLRTTVYDVDFDKQVVNCIGVTSLGNSREQNIEAKPFDFHYDQLVLAHGARPNTFGTPGVEEHAFFLREVQEARAVRRRMVQNLMAARLPICTEEDKRRLLHVVVVGGGPTGVEFASDLAEFLHTDVPKFAPALLQYTRLTLLEAREVLGTFDQNLRNYGARRLVDMGIEIRQGIVSEVTANSVTLNDGTTIPTSLVVWSTGVGPSSLTQTLKCDKVRGRIAIDDRLRALRDGKPLPGVFAIGDCAADAKDPLPTLAAVASRQGKHLAKELNFLNAKGKDPGPFVYESMGSMVGLGTKSALVDVKGEKRRFDLKGLRALFFWRSAYMTMLISMRTRLYVMVNWCGSMIFGRDITYVAELRESKLWNAIAEEGASRETQRRQLEKQQRERITSAHIEKEPAHEASP